MAKQRKTVYQKEMLDKKLKKIDEVFKMVSEIYRNGPTKGLSQIFLREQTPALKRRSVSRSPIRGKSTNLATSPPIRFLPSTEQQKNQQLTRGIDVGLAEDFRCYVYYVNLH